jgi:hypothetical protein
VRNGKLLSNSWRTSPDALIDYLSKVTGSKLFATWYYEINKQSIESTNVPIETYFDFMWWISFNYDYYTWVIHTWFYVLRQHNISWEDCQRKFVGWFRTTPYQLWAMNNNGAMVKHTDKLGSFKHHPKQYIYEYDRNEYYYRYKIKLISTGRAYKSVADKPFAITDQFEILYLEKDINQILELLPTHLT